MAVIVESIIETQSQLRYPWVKGGAMGIDAAEAGNAKTVAEGCPDAGCGKVEARRAVALTSLRSGQTGVVCETCMEAGDATVLRAMGLRPNSLVRVCRVGEPTIIEVLPGVIGQGPQCARPDCRCRLGLAWVLAQRVMVRVDGA